ncbi:hypothetical protein [Microbispora bryophytorum]|uniref:Uncharacterized protein n=1 Tax=Microbispora bryophytorum TaxID=1460882 RepID=A0A8H9H4R0_9ACTN|nr:hypothetical protein [Microbispora bryophytorum]GGO28884.1 hypothetical protein GCM10011574_63780 [Microbispora bryophytorum]
MTTTHAPAYTTPAGVAALGPRVSPAACYVTGATLVVDGGLDANLGLLPVPEPR